MARPHAYCEYIPPRTPWQWVWMRASQWRTRLQRWRERGDGRDYTGRQVRVLSPIDVGANAPAGTTGRVVWCQDPGTHRAMHHVEFEGRETWVLPLPSRHLELLPPG